ncbi:MAG TPA: hypothetical protein DDW20_02675 [Firmicutes bacterium]|nr:hypothetical protein [Bacillota bacterium]
MMEIIKKSDETMTKKDIFMLTKNQSIRTVKSLSNGTKINVCHWVEFKDTNASGEIVEILSMMDEDGSCYATNSKAFKEMFADIVTIMDGESFTIEKLGGKTKAGRDFVTCGLL